MTSRRRAYGHDRVGVRVVEHRQEERQRDQGQNQPPPTEPDAPYLPSQLGQRQAQLQSHQHGGIVKGADGGRLPRVADSLLRRQRAVVEPPSPEEQAALNYVTERLIRIADDTIDFVFDSIDPPKAGSSHARATEADLRDAYDYAGHLIYATHDHLWTILAIIRRGKLPSYAMYTLLRPAAEAAVRAKHLLEPTISETDRLGRGMNERLDNLDEQKKAGADPADIASRISHLEARATTNAVPICWSKSGSEIVGFSEPVKSDIELFRLHLLEGDVAFRFLSAHVHSKPWVQLPKDRATATPTPTISSISTEINLIVFCGVLDSVLTLQDENIGHILVLSGYPLDAWSLMKSRTISAMGTDAHAPQ